MKDYFSPQISSWNVFKTDYMDAFGTIKLGSSEKMRIILSEGKKHVREMLCM
jgi:hypothetical protein